MLFQNKLNLENCHERPQGRRQGVLISGVLVLARKLLWLVYITQSMTMPLFSCQPRKKNVKLWEKIIFYQIKARLISSVDFTEFLLKLLNRVLANNFLSYCNKSCNNWDLLNYCNNFTCNNEFWIIAIKLLRNKFAITLQ